MFLLLAILAISKNFKKNLFLKENGDEEGDETFALLKIVLENLDDFLNGGVNSDIYTKTLGSMGDFSGLYETFTTKLSNKTLQIYDEIYNPDDENDDSGSDNDDDYDYGSSSSKKMKKGAISNLIDTETKLYDVIDGMKEMFEDEDYQKMFNAISEIVSQLGPELAKAANIDFGAINNIYKYVLNNKNNGNDGVKIGKILDYLGLPKDWVPQVKKVVANFDNTVPVSTLFDGLNCATQYNTFVSKIEKLKVPKDATTKFLSVNNVIEAVSSGIDLFRAINTNFIQKYFDSLVKPIITTYGIKPINIFEVGLSDRANSLLNVINIVKGYENSCKKESDTDYIKCTVYNYVLEFAKEMFCYEGYNYTTGEYIFDPKCVANIFKTLEDYVKPFTAEEVDLKKFLIDQFELEKGTVEFIFGLIANLTDAKKNYLDILEGTSLLFSKDDVLEYDFLFYRGVPYHTVIKNVTSLVRFMNTVDDNSNFKLIFDYLNMSDYWDALAGYIDLIDKDTSLCTIYDYEGEECKELTDYIKQIAANFITDEPLNDILTRYLEEMADYLTVIAIPALKSLNNNFGDFLSGGYKSAIPFLNDMFKATLKESVSFTNIVKNGGGAIDSIISLIDELIPSFVKQLPIFGDLYSKSIEKSRQLISVFKDNKNVRGILDTFYDGIGIFVEMLANAAKAYVNEETATVTVVKGLTPTKFLDVFNTASGISKLEDLGIKKIISAIKYDGSKAMLLAANNLNDVIPVKTISENSAALSSAMKKNDLKLDTVASSLGVTKEDLKETLKSTVQTAVSSPSEVVKDVAVSMGADEQEIKKVLEGISDMSQKAAEGKPITTDPPGEYNTGGGNKKGKGLPLGAIIGIVVGCVVVVGIAIFLGVYFGVIRKRNRGSSEKQNDSDGGDKKEEKNDDL